MIGPLDVLLWALAAFAGLLVLTTVAFLVVFAWAALVGLRQMRADENEEIFTGRKES